MRLKHIVYCLSVAIILTACSKSGDSPTPNPPSPPPTPSEAAIVFSIDIDPGSGSIFAATGASQALKVNVSSNLPTAGVVVDVKTTRDSDNTVISSSSLSSTAAITSASIDSLKPGVLCTATIIVTSKSTSSNSATKTFKIVRK